MAPAGSAPIDRAAKAETIKVVDFELRPSDVELKSGRSLDFRWSPRNSNPHHIVLRSGPNGIDKADFTSATGERGVDFTPRFAKAGTYRFVCSIHPISMKLTVDVTGKGGKG